MQAAENLESAAVGGERNGGAYAVALNAEKHPYCYLKWRRAAPAGLCSAGCSKTVEPLILRDFFLGSGDSTEIAATRHPANRIELPPDFE